ncbi:MAG: FKBP-type peptidyl-prolyl cis-trans isomerase [Candidatus Thermoplasmatota archaeon]|nr:FKBP-type peptidyl-prolyl cis-trans isomerase [Candidatus Thermoplasmatota archaeon]
MNNEKIAMIALVVIIAGALSLFLVSTYGGDILNNLFDDTTDISPDGEDNIIEEGDCADVHYIVKYASNGTFINSTYADWADKTGGNVAKIFVSLDDMQQPPTGYTNYTAMDYVEGLRSRLIGKEEGESYTFEIPPDEAYGMERLDIGDEFYSTRLALYADTSVTLNQTFEVTKKTSDNLSIKWVNLDDYGKFTMPQYLIKDFQAASQEDLFLILPPYFLWENSSEIIDYDNDTVTVKTTPTETENLVDSFEQIFLGFGQEDIFAMFPNATTAEYNETTITVRSDPEVGSEYEYTQLSPYGQQITMGITVKNMTSDTIGLTISAQGSVQNQTVKRQLEFNRTYEFPRLFENIPPYFQEAIILDDLEQQGYGLDPLAGETLEYEVMIQNVYKTSTE